VRICSLQTVKSGAGLAAREQQLKAERFTPQQLVAMTSLRAGDNDCVLWSSKWKQIVSLAAVLKTSTKRQLLSPVKTGDNACVWFSKWRESLSLAAVLKTSTKRQLLSPVKTGDNACVWFSKWRESLSLPVA
jgi:uncharacterized protein (DUF2237 family)